MYIIYKLLFASGKAYIGQTVRTMNTRIAQHKRSVRSGSLLPVHCAWRKYGEPAISLIAEFDTQEELHAAEKAAIIALGTLAPQGYNVAYGGETAPSKNPDVAAKISAKAAGRVHKAPDQPRCPQDEARPIHFNRYVLLHAKGRQPKAQDQHAPPRPKRPRDRLGPQPDQG